MLRRISNVALVCAVVLFSYAIAAAQNTPTTTSTNPRVVVTDNLAKTTPTTSQPTAGATKTTTVGKYSISIKEGVTGQNMENGKYVTVTKWDGTKWVSKREWVANPPKPNPQ